MKSKSFKITIASIIVVLLVVLIGGSLLKHKSNTNVDQTSTTKSNTLDTLPDFVKATPSLEKVSKLENKTLTDMKRVTSNYDDLLADFKTITTMHQTNVKALNRTNLSEADFHKATDYTNKLDTYLKYLRAYATHYSQNSKLAKKNSDDFTRNAINQKNIDAKNKYLDSKQDWLSAYSKIMAGN